jgi:hypothetical protein
MFNIDILPAYIFAFFPFQKTESSPRCVSAPSLSFEKITDF